MRDLKFRAWSKEWNKYSKPFTLHCDVINFTNPNGLGTIKSLGDEIVEQYTGLKDKNCKEICEGDIVLHAKESNMTSKCTMIGPYAIGWNDFEAHFELIGCPVHGRLIYKSYEIIGNIHEDKHLIEQRKGG